MQEMHRMLGQKDPESEEALLFVNSLQEMKTNKYFKEFFLFHEASLANGLKSIDESVNKVNYFAKQFMAHLQKSNKFRQLNKEAFEQLKSVQTCEKSLKQIGD